MDNTDKAMESLLILRRCHARISRFATGVSIREIAKARGLNRMKKLAQFILNFDCQRGQRGQRGQRIPRDQLNSSTFRDILEDLNRSKPASIVALFHSMDKITGYIENWNLTNSFGRELTMSNEQGFDFILDFYSIADIYSNIVNRLIRQEIFESYGFDLVPSSDYDLEILT